MTNEKFTEILKVLGSPEKYSRNESFEIPDDFQFSEEVQKAKEARDKLNEELKTHPYYKSHAEEHKASYYEIYDRYKVLPSEYDVQEKEYLDSLGVGMYEEVENEGGEGQGDSCHFVLHFPDVDKYIYASGSYASGEGKDYSYAEWSIVRPTERTITVYE